MDDNSIPICEPDVEPRLRAADLQNVEARIAGIVWIIGESAEGARILAGFGITTLFRGIGNQIRNIMRVIPIVARSDMLLRHVIAVHLHGPQESIARAFVIADPVINVARHVDHVARSRGERVQNFRAL